MWPRVALDNLHPRPNSWPPNFEADLVVGEPPRRYSAEQWRRRRSFSALLPQCLGTTQSLGDAVSVTVLHGGRVIFGPARLGNPLRQNLGTVDLWTTTGPAPRPAGTHRGAIEIDGDGQLQDPGKV